ncbi:hypothetical protein EB796_020995 [Bugula neritina]|uniref:Uncharacterized protein n=1 Tax=Bugula neritina TaxID=10212 RepID=A0A7J7J5J4_BUGNE|nr:hypothetical protein EB796_020995 [Bugula neritina]
MTDIFRAKHPTAKVFTWYGHQGKQASRLDKFFTPIDLPCQVSSEFFPYSDHKTVSLVVSLETAGATSGKSYWKLNVSVLEHESYRGRIRELLTDCRTLRPAFDTAGEWWADIKRRIKVVTTKHCSLVKASSTAEEADIRTSLEKETDLIKVSVLKEKLKSLEYNRFQALRARARFRKDKFDEKCTPFFYNRIRERRAQKSVTKIKAPSGKVETTTKGILKTFHDFYTNLYKKAPYDAPTQERILRCTTERQSATVGNNDLSVLKLTPDNLRHSVFSSKTGSTPGPDGLPAEFYRVFFDDLADILLGVYVEIATTGCIPRSMLEAITILIPKQETH